jgi:hypothetical protein
MCPRTAAAESPQPAPQHALDNSIHQNQTPPMATLAQARAYFHIFSLPLMIYLLYSHLQ